MESSIFIAVAEYEVRYNTRVANGFDDKERAEVALEGARGKRLKYQGSHA